MAKSPDDLRVDLDAMRKLKQEFDIAHQSAIQTGDAKDALMLKEELERNLGALRESVGHARTDAEFLRTANRDFLLRQFSDWYRNADASDMRRTVSDPNSLTIVEPEKIKYADRGQENRAPLFHFGKYTLNPAMQYMDYERQNFFSPRERTSTIQRPTNRRRCKLYFAKIRSDTSFSRY